MIKQGLSEIEIANYSAENVFNSTNLLTWDKQLELELSTGWKIKMKLPIIKTQAENMRVWLRSDFNTFVSGVDLDKNDFRFCSWGAPQHASL